MFAHKTNNCNQKSGITTAYGVHRRNRICKSLVYRLFYAVWQLLPIMAVAAVLR